MSYIYLMSCGYAFGSVKKDKWLKFMRMFTTEKEKPKVTEKDISMNLKKLAHRGFTIEEK